MSRVKEMAEFIKSTHCTCMTKRPEPQYHKNWCPMNSPKNPLWKGEVFQLASGCIDCGPFTKAYAQRVGDELRCRCGTCGGIWTQELPEADISALESRVDQVDSVIEGPLETPEKPVLRPSLWEIFKGVFK